MKLYDDIDSREKFLRFQKVIQNETYALPDEVDFKVNFDAVLIYSDIECYREMMVSYFSMLPLLEMPQVQPEYADYIIYMHPYARCQDASSQVIQDLNRISKFRKSGAEIIVVGKAANAQKLLNGSIPNITFYGDHFTEKLGKRFGIDMSEKYFVYNPVMKHLAIWPVDGCLQHCKFCRRTYMDIKFESIDLETIKENLDSIKQHHPEWLKTISLRAENLTEYGIDIYGKPMLHKLLDLLNSYDEVETFQFPIGLAIGEITPEILNSLCQLKKIDKICLNLEAGSDRLLKLIGKNHSYEDAINVYQMLRKSHPHTLFQSTVMVGLPTEQITDILSLAELIAETTVDDVLCNYYILAPKHPLAKLPQISNSLREYHLKILIRSLKTRIKKDFVFTCYDVPKNKKSRKYTRALQKIEEQNKHETFPIHMEITYHTKKKSY